MMIGPAENSNSYDTVKTRRRKPRQTLPDPSSSSDESEELGQRQEFLGGAGETSVPPSRNSGQPGNGPVKIRNSYQNNPNPTGTPNPNPAGTSNRNPTGAPNNLPSTTGKQKRTESKGRKGWSREENLELVKMYYQSDINSKGFRRRLYYLWQNAGMERVADENQLAGQVRSILKGGLKKNHLTDQELMELRERHMPTTAASMSTSDKDKKKKKMARTLPSQEPGPSREPTHATEQHPKTRAAAQPPNLPQTPEEREREQRTETEMI